jgi:hypothetical protein
MRNESHADFFPDTASPHRNLTVIYFCYIMCPHCLNCTCDRSVLFRWKKIYWQSLTGNGSLNPPFGLVGFERIKRTWNYISKVTPSEKKISIDDFTALGFQNYDTSGVVFF